ncbi:MAG: 16S rRNA (cytosine(967)-C(5))-methyltransferase RsmB, partial [Candidatus Adiutrix sp.]|nr:16S rRNA (cytosine(967)-C(5))-methyltransferase RsmB [Candidatus Adiutrix sp.]
EAARLGCAAGLVTETRDLLAAPPPAASFDLALLDAPCSGLGVVRRRPDLKWNKQPQDIARLAEGQSALLAAVAPAVKPGGRLLYGVCSVNDEEGPEIIRRFLADRADFQALPAAAWPESLRPFLKDGPGLTLWPHRHGLDGFFWASLRRSGGARSGLSGP